MIVSIFGANGQIGRILSEKLSKAGYTVRAIIRNEDQAAHFRGIGAEPVIADLEDSVKDLSKAIEGSDVVVFTAGSGGKTGADKTILVDLDGAIKTVEAAQEAGVSRYLMVSSIGAGGRDQWREPIKHYHAAKYYADRALEESDLDYTIIRPGGLLNDAGTGKIGIAPTEMGTIPREDVAAVIVASIKEKATYRKAFVLVSGEESIPEALQKL